MGGSNQHSNVTAESYQRMLDLYRKQQLEGKINHSRIALELGIPISTCRKGYSKGWSNREGFSNEGKPIEKVLLEEAIHARAALRREDGTSEELSAQAVLDNLKLANLVAVSDVTESRKVQGKMIKVSRQNSRQLLAFTSLMIQASAPILKQMKETLETRKLDLQSQMRLMKDIAGFAKTATEVAMMTEKMEAACLGDPQAILSLIETDDSDDMSEEGCIEQIERVQLALQRSKDDGNIVDGEFTDIEVE